MEIFFEKWHFAILVVSSPIFVVDTKIIPVYNFVAPLTKGYVRKEILIEDFHREKKHQSFQSLCIKIIASCRY